MTKIVDLNKRKRDLEMDENLQALALDREMINNYDGASLKDVSSDLIEEFFKAREDVSDKFSQWLSKNLKNTKDFSLMGSVLCEHFQNLLIPDPEELGMEDALMGRKSEEEMVNMMEELDRLMVLAAYLENFHMANMKQYVKESLKEKNKRG